MGCENAFLVKSCGEFGDHNQPYQAYFTQPGLAILEIGPLPTERDHSVIRFLWCTVTQSPFISPTSLQRKSIRLTLQGPFAFQLLLRTLIRTS